jgi:hypothetical protein
MKNFVSSELSPNYAIKYQKILKRCRKGNKKNTIFFSMHLDDGRKCDTNEEETQNCNLVD